MQIAPGKVKQSCK